MKQRLTAKRITDALRESKGMIAVAARRIGCSRTTIYAWAEHHPEIKAALEDERELMTDLAELSLYKQVQGGEGWAVQFYLRTQGRKRGYGDQVNVRHGGDDTAPPIATENKTVHIYIPANGREVGDGARGDGTARDGRVDRPATGAADDLPDY